MSSRKHAGSARSELVEVAAGVIEGRINAIDGLRRIVRLRFAVDDPDSEVFMPIRAVESELDQVPVGEARGFWREDALRTIDAESEDVLAASRDDVLRACRAIVEKYGAANEERDDVDR